MKVYTLDQILPIVTEKEYPQIISEIEKAFVKYSMKQTVIPPVGQLHFPELDADVHIKYGYIRNDDSYVIKIASGFPHNDQKGLPTSTGMIMVFSSKTGELKGILEDHGYLTDLRTAIAGAIAAKYIGPSNVQAVGIVGTGTQAVWQLELLKHVVPFNEVFVFGRNTEHVDRYRSIMATKGIAVTAAKNIRTITEMCNLIVTTTYSSVPLIHGDMLRPGTHITAMGADSPNKHEIAESCFRKASAIICDSIAQCCEYGDTSFALRSGDINPSKIRELGDIISDNNYKRNCDDITIADLTGVAVQDIAIAEYILNMLQ